MEEKTEELRNDYHSINNLLNKIATQAGVTKYHLEMKGLDPGKIEEEKDHLIKIMDGMEENALKISEILKRMRKAGVDGNAQ
jgi:DNA-directed RNA polymerase subunit F